MLGTALLRVGDAAGAELELRRAVEAGHPFAAVAPGLAQSLLALREHQRLINQLSRLELAAATEQASLKTAVAAAFNALHQPNAANEALASAWRADPDYVPAWLLQAQMLAVQNDAGGALASIERVLAKDSGNAAALKLKSNLLPGSTDSVGQEPANRNKQTEGTRVNARSVAPTAGSRQAPQ